MAVYLNNYTDHISSRHRFEICNQLSKCLHATHELSSVPTLGYSFRIWHLNTRRHTGKSQRFVASELWHHQIIFEPGKIWYAISERHGSKFKMVEIRNDEFGLILQNELEEIPVTGARIRLVRQPDDSFNAVWLTKWGETIIKQIIIPSQK